MATEFLNVKITLDTGEVKSGLVAIEKQAKEVSESSGSDLKGGFDRAAIGVIGINQALELADKAMNAVLNTGRKLFEQVLKGEEESAIVKRFEILANGAGQIPQSLVLGIKSAIDGTVDMEDALRLASEAVVRLGQNSDKIPQIFEIAKKSALVFGGTTEEAFTKISTAIASGQLRSLKSIGIIIDAKKAQDEYAKSIGTTADVLTEEQRSLAAFNEIIAKSGDRLKDVKGSLTPVAEEFKRFKVQLGEVFDAIAIGFNSVFGDTVKSALSGFGTALKTVANELNQTFNSSITDTDKKVNTLQSSLQSLNAQLKLETEGTAPYQKLNAEIEKLQGRLDGILERQNKVNQLNINTQAQSADNTPIDSQISDEARAKRLASETEINNQILSLQSQSIQDQLKNADLLNLSLLDKKNLYLEQISLETETLNSRIADIDFKYANQGLAVQEAANNLKIQEEARYRSRISAISEQSNKLEQSKLKNFSQIMADVGAQAQNTFARGIGNAFESVGKALAKGESAWVAFREGFKKVLADIASATGDVFIGQGIGYLFAGNVAAGAGLIAAGASLKVLAGLLGGSAASNATPTTNADAASGSSSASAASSSLTTQDQVRQPDTRVVVNIQGSIYDSADTGSRIVELINSSFDKTGSVITRGAVA